MKDPITRSEWDELHPLAVKAMVEVASCALDMVRLKWWQFGKRRRLAARIELVRSCYALRPLSYLN